MEPPIQILNYVFYFVRRNCMDETVEEGSEPFSSLVTTTTVITTTDEADAWLKVCGNCRINFMTTVSAVNVLIVISLNIVMQFYHVRSLKWQSRWEKASCLRRNLYVCHRYLSTCIENVVKICEQYTQLYFRLLQQLHSVDSWLN